AIGHGTIPFHVKHEQSIWSCPARNQAGAVATAMRHGLCPLLIILLAVFQDFGSKDRARLRSPSTHEASVSDEIEETAGIMLVEREALVQRIPGLLDGL